MPAKMRTDNSKQRDYMERLYQEEGKRLPTTPERRKRIHELIEIMGAALKANPGVKFWLTVEAFVFNSPNLFTPPKYTDVLGFGCSGLPAEIEKQLYPLDIVAEILEIALERAKGLAADPSDALQECLSVIKRPDDGRRNFFWIVAAMLRFVADKRHPYRVESRGLNWTARNSINEKPRLAEPAGILEDQAAETTKETNSQQQIYG